MNKNTVILILAVVSLSLLGLSIVQIKWIREAISVKEEQFDQNVYTALRQVVRTIEMKEIQERMEWIDEPMPEPFLSKRQMRRNMYRVPSVADVTFEIESVVHGSEDENSNHFHRKEQIVVNAKGDIQRYDIYGESDANPEMIIMIDSVSGKSVQIDTVKVYEMIDEQTRNMKTLFLDRIFGTKTLEDRIDSTELDNWVRTSLQNNGVKTDVQYALFSPHSEVIYQACEDDPSYVMQSPYAVNLYPHDPFAEKGTLAVYFPKQKRYILSSMGLMLGSSGVFILMLLGSFFLLAQTIFKQKKLSDMKTDFINNMTHELKTPVATISLASEMLKNDQVNDEQEAVKRYANIIFKENKRLGNQVERVLQISRLDKGEINLNLEPVELNDMLTNVVDHFGLQLEDANATVNLQLSEHPIVLEMDQMHMTNVVGNLIDNAIKYCSKDPDIKIRSLEKRSKIIIQVEDNGIGLSKDDRQRIFDKFYRASQGDKHDVKGFGLGLSYVKKIMDAHEAEVRVQSELGKGSTFELIFDKTTA